MADASTSSLKSRKRLFDDDFDDDSSDSDIFMDDSDEDPDFIPPSSPVDEDINHYLPPSPSIFQFPASISLDDKLDEVSRTLELLKAKLFLKKWRENFHARMLCCKLLAGVEGHCKQEKV
ncbi:hypothetical protein LSTR_LSTR002200 [Laodelphax striatellus]|uniref:Uncharacterized protein n=1 Tax=Laodelphax striatellus TaxID=195883 RepID=A0A482XR32_LAOST|nr:hypothetical protein LSTR_LSTR002200 [Laodelphax striatellus]